MKSNKQIQAARFRQAVADKVNAVLKKSYSEIDEAMRGLGLWYADEKSAADVVYDAVDDLNDSLPLLTENKVAGMMSDYLIPAAKAAVELRRRLDEAAAKKADAEKEVDSLKSRIAELERNDRPPAA